MPRQNGSVTQPLRGFDFTGQMRRVCLDMIERLPELRHIDLSRVAVSFTQTRRAQLHGVQATLTPMRFENGATTTVRGGRRIGVQKVLDEFGREYLYLLSFYLPRFQNRTFEDKVATIVHELWHISPLFNGDLRRFGGRCFAHGPSQKQYDAQVQQLADRWWSQKPDEALVAFLRQSFQELERQHGRVFGMKIAAPKLIPVGEV